MRSLFGFERKDSFRYRRSASWR